MNQWIVKTLKIICNELAYGSQTETDIAAKLNKIIRELEIYYKLTY